MITIKHPVSPDITYPLERIAPLRDLLFFDIETTGFSGDTSQLYLIGCVYHCLLYTSFLALIPPYLHCTTLFSLTTISIPTSCPSLGIS